MSTTPVNPDVVIGAPQYANPDNVVPRPDTDVALKPPPIMPGGATMRTIPNALVNMSIQNAPAPETDEEQAARKYSQPPQLISAKTHNIVAAPDGAKIAFPKDTPSQVMHQEMQKWWEPHLQRTADAWHSVANALSNASQAVGLPSSLSDWETKEADFLRDPGGTTVDAVGTFLNGLNTAVMALGPGNEENKALVARAQEEWRRGNHIAAATTMVPLIGDGLAKAVKQAQSRDYSGSFGTTVGTALPFVAGELRAGEAGEGAAVRPEAVTPEAYSEPERRAEARPLMSPTEIEAAMKNRRMQAIKTPFDTTEGASETVNRDLANRVPNASGESAASQEAINRVASQKAQGIKTYRVDSRSGVATPVLGVDAVDATAAPYEHIVQVKDGKVDQIQDSGNAARPLDEQKLAQQVVGSTEAAARDTANYTQAKSELGPEASFSDVAQRAQKLKDTHVSRGADAFNAENGRPPIERKPVVASENAKAIADEYDKLQHNPNDPEVQKSFEAMKNDIDDQWNFATQKMGIDMEPWTAEGQPYKNSKEMAADVKNNHHLYFFQGGDIPSDHPSSADAGQGLTYTDKFRAVHDLFGHAANENQFGPNGEERAWREHLQMFSPEAAPAVTTLTRGQNSWVNFGKHLRDAEGNIPAKGETGYVSPAERPYAEQKAALLPNWVNQPEGAPSVKTKFRPATLDEYAKDNRNNAQAATLTSPEQMASGTKFYTNGEGVSYAISPEGDLQGVVNNSGKKGAIAAIMPDAIKNGAKTLDAWDIYLPKQYAKYGFETVKTVPYDEATYGPPSEELKNGWKAQGWKEGDPLPSVAFMELNKPVSLKDLWTDESGTYTSGKFMKWLAKNNLSDQGQKVLNDASKEKIVPGWDEVSKFLTPEDRDRATTAIQKNVVSLVNSFNPEWVTEAAKAGSVAKGWYRRATALIQHMMGEDSNRFTDFVASLSPQKDVEQNLTDALNFYSMWKDAGSPLGPENADKIRDLVNQAETGMSGQVARNQLYDNLVNNAPPSGPKVSNFARNLKGEMNDVTKDRWMAYMFGNNERMFRWFKAGDPKPAVHLAADALIRAVGQHIGMLPAEVQETGWSFLRSVVNLSEKEGISTNEAVKRINEGTIKFGASELTRLVADSPKVRAALSRLADITGNDQLRPSTLESSPTFKRLLKEHAEQAPTAGGLGAANRDILKRGVKSAVKARSELTEQRNAAPAAPKKASKPVKDKGTEFNPAEMGSNITPELSERMKSALA